MRVLATRLAAGLACACMGQAALAECPTAADRPDGFVLETRDGENSYHVKARADNMVWVGISNDGRALSEANLAWSRVTDHGILVTKAASNWSSWYDQDDLSVLSSMDVDDIVEINGFVSGDRHADGEAALATFRLLRTGEVTLGDCSYATLDFGANTKFFKSDGSIDGLPGHFRYVPDLMIALAGMWDGGLRGNVTGIRKATPDDWFGQ